MHPGWADTEGVRTALPGFRKALGERLRTPQQGVDTVLWLALQDNSALQGGGFYLDRAPQHKHSFLSGTHYSQAESDALLAKLDALSGCAPAPVPRSEAAEAPAGAAPDAAELET